MAQARTGAPRSNKDPDEVERKVRLLSEPHVAPLARYVERIRAERGIDRVPDFDPTEAGVGARILLLLEAPGPRATRERGGSGFVSPDNNDQTAENMWHLLRDASIDRSSEVVTWNIVPWYIGNDDRIRAAKGSDLGAGRGDIYQLIDLLPDLRIVVLIGKKAAAGWKQLGLQLPTIEAPHPSPKNLNTRPRVREELLDALVSAKEAATLGPSHGG